MTLCVTHLFTRYSLTRALRSHEETQLFDIKFFSFPNTNIFKYLFKISIREKHVICAFLNTVFGFGSTPSSPGARSKKFS